MTTHPPRKPATFKLDDPSVVVHDPDDAPGRPARGTIQVMPEPDAAQLPATIEAPLPPARRGFRWGALFWSALGGLVSLGVGLSAARLIDDLFAFNQGLGLIGLGLALATLVAFLVIAGREALGLARLSAIEKLHQRAAAALLSDDRNEGRAVVDELLKMAGTNPRLARARASLESHAGDIIDGADRIRLAERELMTPLDRDARALVSAAAQRVSVVTAVSPRAVFDILSVAYAAMRMIRELARLYGARPGALGMIRLMRHALAHLAVTGGIAAGDSLIQQMLGHGIAARLSARLGEGVLNGLMTARLGLAAIDVIRPLPFAALERPVLSDLARDLLAKRGTDE